MAALAIGLLFAGPSSAGTISRCAKAAGGTDFSDSTVALASEVNCDFNTIYTLVNGSLDADNLSASSVGTSEITDLSIVNIDVSNSAAIDVSKLAQTAGQLDADIVGDYAADPNELVLVTDPGETGSESLPTHLEEEIERLRYAIKRLGLGEELAFGTKSWIDPPAQTKRNLIYAGTFEHTNGTGSLSADPNDPPGGWTLSNTPQFTYAAVPVAEGSGVEVTITAGGATDEGMQQTLSGLKANHDYLLLARVEPGTGTCSVRTTGGGTNVSQTSASGTGSYETLAGVFTTDGTPADVVVLVEADADGDVCSVRSVAAYELSPDSLEEARPAFLTSSTTSTTTCDGTSYGSGNCSGLLSLSYTPPAPGYALVVTGTVQMRSNTSSEECLARLYDGSSQLDEKALTHSDASGGANLIGSLALQHIESNPAPGTTITYQIDARGVASNNCSVNEDETGGSAMGETNLHLMAFPGM